jgi:hypothetical protein
MKRKQKENTIRKQEREQEKENVCVRKCVYVQRHRKTEYKETRVTDKERKRNHKTKETDRFSERNMKERDCVCKRM